MSRRTRFIGRLTQPAGTLPALVWAACILLILALTVIGFPKGALSTDILDLLPSSSADVRTGELAQAATRGIADRVIWAVRVEPRRCGRIRPKPLGARARHVAFGPHGRSGPQDLA